MSQNENFGIMDEGYFVPRSEILSWVNNLLKIHLTKIEELGSGAAYCQIIDAIHPGKVAMAKVSWKAKADYEFLNNYKILQTAFDKFGIKRYIDVERLSKAKYQDNLEFIQWLKRYYEVNGGEKSEEYNAEERRGNAKIDFSFAQKIVVPKNFNAGGQVIPKARVNSKEKRQTGASGQKDSVKRLASPQNIQKIKTPSQQKKPTIQRNTSSKDLKKAGTQVQTRLPPNPHHKTVKIQPKSEQVEESISIRPNRASFEQLEALKKKVFDLESKLEMITEIAQTKDQAEIKMKLIEEVLSIGLSKMSDSEIVPNQSANYVAPKSEEIDVYESIEMSQSLAQQQVYAIHDKKEVAERGSKLQSQHSKMNGFSEIKVHDEQQAF